LRFAITSPLSGCEEDFHLQAVEHARRTQKKSRPGVPSGYRKEIEKIVWLLADHLLDHVADDGQLELFVAVSFEHHKNPGSKEGQANDG
jgi:hypothetical protein